MTGSGTYSAAGAEPDSAGITGRRDCRFSACTVTFPAPAGVIVLARVAGEIDLHSQPALNAAVSDVLRASGRQVVVDLAGVTFCSVRGFVTLAAAADRAAVRGTGYAVSGLAPRLERIALTYLWEPERPRRYRSAAAAITAIRADQARHHRPQRPDHRD